MGRPKLFWNNTNSLKLVGDFYLEYGRLPMRQELRNRDDKFQGLNVGIRNLGGFIRVAELLNLEPTKKPNGYWNKWENVKKEIHKLLEENPQFESLPSQGDLVNLGYRSLNQAIIAFHGGYHEVRKRLGLSPIGENVPKNKWKDLEFTIKRAREIMDKHGFETFPHEGILRSLGINSINSSIQKYHGGVQKFREILGVKEGIKKSETWKSLDYVLKYAQEFLEQNPQYKNLPSTNILYKIGETKFLNALRYHGGYLVFKRQLHEYLGIEDKTPLNTEKKLQDFLGRNKEAKKITNLISITGNTGVIANILVKLYPERFPSEKDLARLLPKSVKMISQSLIPFTLENAKIFYDTDFSIPREIQFDLEKILFNILVDEYQKSINEYPKGIIIELRRFVNNKNEVSKLAKKVLNYYQEIYKFNIPGFGNLKGAD